MHGRIARVVILALLVTTPSQAGWRDALKRGTDSLVRKTRSVARKTADAVKSGNPKSAIFKKLKSPDGLSRAAGRVGSTITALRNISKADVLPYRKLSSQWNTKKRARTFDPTILALLDDASLKQSSYRIEHHGNRYFFYDTGSFLFPYDPDSPSIPLDNRLDVVAEAGVTRSYAKKMNGRYFKNLDRLASTSANTSQAIEEVANIALDFINKIYRTSVMGIGAVSIIDPLIVSASGGVDLQQIHTALTQIRDGARAIRATAGRIAAGTDQVRTGLAACKKNESAATDIVRTGRGMQSIGTELGSLSRPFGDFRRDLARVRSGITRLQSFTKVPGIQFATRAVSKVDQGAEKIESGINNYAGSFTGFSGRMNNEGAQLAGNVRSHFAPRLEAMAAPLEQEGETLLAARSALGELSGRWELSSQYSTVDAFGSSAETLVTASKQARQTDVVLALRSTAALDEHLAAAPFAAFAELSTTLTKRIAEDQIIGTPETHTVLARIEALDTNDRRDERFQMLGVISGEIGQLESNVSSANTKFYVVMVLLVLLSAAGGAVGFVMWRKRRATSDLGLGLALEEYQPEAVQI